ncbi:MAG: DUF1761 domain-containing protein [Gammaproteobacteria bacterium]|nr:DUF1761 domain-containing protein [Gammaproteobacteria bacterium]
MDIATTLSGINWIAVIAAALAAFALGAGWYSMPLFGRTWMREIGLSEETAGSANMPLVFGTAFVLQFAAATALAASMPATSTWLTGIQCGLVVGVFWVASAFAITYLFEQRSMRLFMINAGYYIVLFAIMGAILGSWH